VIGASNARGSVGYTLLRNIIDADFAGVVYPVNRAASAVHGIQAYPTIAQVPHKVDLAIIAVPADSVPDVVRQCGEAGCGGAVIVSSGFKETGPLGQQLEEAALANAKTYGLRLLGPNCLGFVRPGLNLNATFARIRPAAGRICFISQSGALGVSVLDWAATNSIGFSAFVSVGSMCDIDFGDLIDYFGVDPFTNAIILHIETLNDARKFMRAARHFAMTKPIIVVKSARSARSALAAAAHTGGEAGNDTLYSAAFRRAGVVRVSRVENLFAASEALTRVASPRGPKLGIVTDAGGPGVMAVDRVLALHGELAELTPETDEALRACLPTFAARSNPVDIGDDADSERFAAATEALLSDPDCDGVLAIVTPRSTTYPTLTAEALVEVARRHTRKPLLAALMGGGMAATGMQILRGAHVPAFHTPEDAVSAYMYMHEYTESLATLYETPVDILPDFTPDRGRVKRLFVDLAHEGRSVLTETETKDVLSEYGVTVIRTLTATTAEECAEAARTIGCPVIIKILSRDITHKFDVGGVAKDVRSATEAGKQFTAITDRVRKAAPEAEVLGVTVHSMSRGGCDVAVRSWRDSTFGPVLMFGSGSGGSELHTDTAVDFPPINQALAHAMIAKTKASCLLDGHRGRAAIDTAPLEQVLVQLSYLLVDFPEIVEMSVEPLQVRPDGVLALDARIAIAANEVHKISRPGAHLVMSMYPSKYRSIVKLGDEEIEIRAIKPEDVPLWTEMISSLTEKTAEYRFFGPVDQITQSMIVAYCHIDYDSEISLVAIGHGADGPRMLGVASLSIDSPNGEEGEFAIVIRDDYQRRSLGRKLTRALIDAARDHYVRELHGLVLANNAPMLRFTESLGFVSGASDEPDLRTITLRI